jgi:hypothetical protein
VAFLDSDDAWLPKKLEVQLGAARLMGALAACSNAMGVDPQGREKGALLEWSRTRLALGDLLAENRVVCSSALVHRSLIARTGGFPEGVEFKAVEDYALWLRVAALTDFAYCRDVLVRYRDHPTASIRSEQNIAPRAQRSLVLRATAAWLFAVDMAAPRRVAALAQVGTARLRHAASGALDGLRRGNGT